MSVTGSTPSADVSVSGTSADGRRVGGPDQCPRRRRPGARGVPLSGTWRVVAITRRRMLASAPPPRVPPHEPLRRAHDRPDRPRIAARQVVAGLVAPGAPFELVTEEVLGAPVSVFANRRRALHELLAESVEHGDRTYIATLEAPDQLRRARRDGLVAGPCAARGVRRAARRPGGDRRRQLTRVDRRPSGRRPRSARSPSGSTPGGRRASWPTASSTPTPSWWSPTTKRREGPGGRRGPGPRRSRRTSAGWPRRTPTPTLPFAEVGRGRPGGDPLHLRDLRPAQGRHPLATATCSRSSSTTG